ncbi:MAG TPA: response regulator [Armatimonadota bacterium]|nr:response regulator [Armatimonadota bacterium]
MSAAVSDSPPVRLVALKLRIQRDFSVIEETPEKIVLGSRTCPSAGKVLGRAALCMRISNVWSPGRLATGLPMVRRLVERRGGTLQASSRGAGPGSEFTVPFPVRSRPKREEPAGEPAPQPPPAIRLRVLLVEDNRDAADTLAEFLALWGHEVSVAYNGHEALEIAPRSAADVVILDIGLPGLNGYEVARRLRDLASISPRCRLVALTGYSDEETRRRAREVGFDLYLTKPVDPETLEVDLCDLVARAQD